MIFYYSGTGNSKYAAKRIADALGDTPLSMNERIKAGDFSPVETGERLVVVTPTYAWRIPRIVRDWLMKTELRGAERIWFVMTCGSEIGDAGRYNRALCQAKGVGCMGTAQLIMPENYIAMFDAPQADEARAIVAKAEPDIDRVIASIRAEEAFAPTRRNLYDRFMSGPVNPIFYSASRRTPSRCRTPASAAAAARSSAPPTPSRSGTASPSGARAVHTAWHVSAIALPPPSSMVKRASASRAITSRRCKSGLAVRICRSC